MSTSATYIEQSWNDKTGQPVSLYRVTHPANNDDGCEFVWCRLVAPHESHHYWFAHAAWHCPGIIEVSLEETK